MARKQGVTDDEIGAVQAIVMAVQAGRVRAQFREAHGAAQEPPAGEPTSASREEPGPTG